MTTTPAPGDGRHGAPLLLPVLAYAALSILAGVIPLLLAGRGAWTSDAALIEVYQHHQNAVRAQAFLTTSAAVPLAVLTAVFSYRIKRLGLDVPGRLITLTGGSVAAGLLATSGLVSLALTGSQARQSLPLLQFGQAIAVALGGTGFAAFTGLLVAGIAVTALLGGLLARPVAIAGLALALLCELALLTTLTDTLNLLLPLARFGSLAWLLAAAVTLRPSPRS